MVSKGDSPVVIAALVSFGALLVAWILAPERRAEPPTVVRVEPEPEPMPAAA
jgi:hypothetical protein